jgi:hypothetical protein
MSTREGFPIYSLCHVDISLDDERLWNVMCIEVPIGQVMSATIYHDDCNDFLIHPSSEELFFMKV